MQQRPATGRLFCAPRDSAVAGRTVFVVSSVLSLLPCYSVRDARAAFVQLCVPVWLRAGNSPPKLQLQL